MDEKSRENQLTLGQVISGDTPCDFQISFCISRRWVVGDRQVDVDQFILVA
jgi:hypothetical protein